jgi:hypothetical protein
VIIVLGGEWKMRNLLIFALILVIVMPFASARLLAEDIHLSKIRLGDYGYVWGKEMESYVFVVNSNPDYGSQDGRVSVRLMDDSIGAYSSTGSFDVRSQKGVGRTLVTQLDGEPAGEYLVKVTYTDGNIHKTKYRYVIVG